MSNAHHSPPTNHPNPRQSESSARAGACAGAKSFPTLDEVKAYAPTVMATADCAERFWNDCESSGWVNRHGQPIVQWQPLFRNFATHWRSNLSRRHGPSHRHAPARSDSANVPGRYG